VLPKLGAYRDQDIVRSSTTWRSTQHAKGSHRVGAEEPGDKTSLIGSASSSHWEAPRGGLEGGMLGSGVDAGYGTHSRVGLVGKASTWPPQGLAA
jgi:hypothetical protein